MEMPRSCSSRRRSVFVPVRRLMSAVLPWSMCPAVPSVRGGADRSSGEPGTAALSGQRGQRGCGQRVELGVAHGAQVEQQALILYAAYHGGLAGAQRRGKPVRVSVDGLSLIHISEPT